MTYIDSGDPMLSQLSEVDWHLQFHKATPEEGCRFCQYDDEVIGLGS